MKHPQFQHKRSTFSILLSLILVFSMVSGALAAPWVANKLKSHRVYDPFTNAYVPGNTKGYTEGQAASFLVEVQGAINDFLQFDICLDYNDSGAYFFTGLEPFDTDFLEDHAAPLPAGILTGNASDNVRGIDITVNSITPLGVTGLGGDLTSLCPNNYIGWRVEFTLNQPLGYLVYGGHLAMPTDPLPTGGTVPANQGAANISGVAQARIATLNGGDKTINFMPGAVAPASADLQIIKTCPNLFNPSPYPFTITVTNLGPGTTGLITVTDTLDNVLLYSGYSAFLTTNGVSTAAGACSAVGQDVTCTLDKAFFSNIIDATSKWVITLNTTLAEGTPDDYPFQNIAVVSSDLADPVVSNNTSSCSTTTPVTIASFSSTKIAEIVHFSWTTATETNNAGFNLWVDGDGGLQKLNRQLIPSAVIYSTSPQDYTFEAEVTGNIFYVEDIDISNRPTAKHGPFQLGESYGQNLTLDIIDWTAIRAEHGTKANSRLDSRLESFRAPLPAAPQIQAVEIVDAIKTFLPLAAKAANTPSIAYPTYYFHVEQDGLYRVTYDELLDAGLDLQGVTVDQIAIYNQGKYIPAYIKANTNLGAFGPGSLIEFYGQALNTLYSRTNVYQLIMNNGSRPVDVDFAQVDASAPVAAFYLENEKVADNVEYNPVSMVQDPWFAKRLFTYNQPSSWDFALQVDDYVPGVSPASLRLEIWGGSQFHTSPDHRLLAELNGEQVADASFDGVTDYYVNAQLPDGALTEGQNNLKITLPGDTGASWDIVNLESYSITYPRAFVARNNQLAFTATGEAFRVSGFSSPDIVVYRLINHVPTRIYHANIENDGAGYSINFAGSEFNATYLVYQANALHKPAITPAPLAQDITSGSADYLIISHPDFIDGLDALIQARTADGLTVKVVDVEQVYHQFGYGLFDPQGIKNYIRHAAQNMGTQYVLLVGGDTYDYHDYSGAGSFSFIPSIYHRAGSEIGYAPVDPLFADIDGDLLPDLALGRFPVRTAAELESVIDKTLVYADKDYSATAIFSADQDFKNDSLSLTSPIDNSWDIQEAYLDDLGVASARSVLINAINTGVALTSFVGHSGPMNWTYAGLFSYTDAASLTNADRPTVVTQWGCWNTYYVDPLYNTLGHQFLLAGNRGAAAVMGSTTITMAYSEEALGELMTPYLTAQGVSIGQAMLNAKQDLAQTQPYLLDVLLGWTILGDPALVIHP